MEQERRQPNIQAKIDLAEAAKDALQILSEASNLQLKTIASAAADAINVVNTKGANDHDLLVELKTKMIELKEDIKELKDGTTAKIEKHEVRLCSVENSITQIKTYGTVAVILIGIAQFILGKVWK